jgi:hypothetical protein
MSGLFQPGSTAPSTENMEVRRGCRRSGRGRRGPGQGAHRTAVLYGGARSIRIGGGLPVSQALGALAERMRRELLIKDR